MKDKKFSISPKQFTCFTKKLTDLGVRTICDSALCINRPECYRQGKATFLIMGDTCTRNCRYCGVNQGIPNKPDPNEPKKIAQAVKELNLRYVVVTSVTRDDLVDQGASYFTKTVKEIKKLGRNLKIELLIPDFLGKKELLLKIIGSKPDVINHNIECTRKRFKLLRPRGNYEVSLKVLKTIKVLAPSLTTKSGFMVGVGESLTNIKKTIIDLKENQVDIITIGQYLPPRNNSFPLVKIYNKDEFVEIEKFAKKLVFFKNVFVGANVRSSYHAEEMSN